MTATLKSKATKAVVTISRNVIKRTGAIVYLCKPSTAGVKPYATTIINGKATGCTCPGNTDWHKFCKHMTHCQAKEQARGILAQATEIVAQAEQAAQVAETKADLECKWYQENYSPLSREAYSSLYDVNNIA